MSGPPARPVPLRTTPLRTVPLRTVAQQWGRIGLLGFGGPPAHIALLRRLVVTERHWIDEREFEDAVAACNLLPGPASTQLAILLARRLAGPLGMIVGGLAFVVPAVVLILALSALFLAHAPPSWIRGAGAGAGAAVAAVAGRAGLDLGRPSWRRTAGRRGERIRWLVYAAIGAVAAALAGPYLVLVLLGAGLSELAIRVRPRGGMGGLSLIPGPWLAVAGAVGSAGGLGSLAWVGFKVGALSYGGGFVIVPLMQSDAVHTYHWMTSTEFLNAVALGQVTPGPVVATVAAVGYAAHGVWGGLLAALVAFSPSFAMVLVGFRHFARLRESERAKSFLAGAGPAAIGAIVGAAVPLAGALRETWQVGLLGAAAVALLALRQSVVLTLVAAGVIGAIVGLAGGPLPR
jgi:chromate transporter